MAENKEMDIVGLMINIFAFIRRYIFVVLGFIVLGAGLGAVDYFTGRNYYKTTLVATSPVIDNQIVYELMGPVKYYVVNEMYDSISEKFDVSLDVAKDIKKIELDTSMVQAVKIELDVYNSENVPAIKDGIIFYLNSIPYVTSTIDSRRSELKGYIKDINEEIEDLNVLQDAIISNIEDEDGSKWVSPGSMFSEMMTMNDRKLELMSEYNSLEYFKVINSNIILEAQKSLKKSILIFSLGGLILGVLFSIIFELLRLIKVRRKELAE